MVLLFTVLVGIVAGVLDPALGLADDSGNGPMGTVAGLAFLLPSLAVSVRRLHDTARSGWWVLLGLIPVVGLIILIIWFVQDSVPGADQHGPNPKAVDAGHGYGPPPQG